MDVQNKPHHGRYFVFGLLTGIFSLLSIIAIVGAVLYNRYEPLAAEKEESLLEDYTNAIVAPLLYQKTLFHASLDYKYVTWDQSDNTFNIHMNGQTTINGVGDLTAFVLTCEVKESSYHEIADNLSASYRSDKDLAINYGAIGLYHIATALGDTSTTYHSFSLGTQHWTLA